MWHYTCDHSADGIRRDGTVKPHPQPALAGVPLSWWTDLERGHRFEVGLTSQILGCDRMRHRFEIKDPSALTPWSIAARLLKVPREVRDDLEDGRLPAHWWVAFTDVEVIT